MKKIKKLTLILSLTGLILLPIAITFAQSTELESVPISNVGDFVTILNRVIAWVQVFFFIIAVLFILMAAFQYLMSSGDPEKVGKAKNMILYAAVAIAVALLATAVKPIVTSILTG